jgi:hypothetical protein
MAPIGEDISKLAAARVRLVLSFVGEDPCYGVCYL